MIITAREKLHDNVHSTILAFHLDPVSQPADGSCKLPKNNNNFSYFSKERVVNSALYIARRHRKQRKFTSQLPNKGTFLASSFAVQGGGRGGEGSDAQIYLVWSSIAWLINLSALLCFSFLDLWYAFLLGISFSRVLSMVPPGVEAFEFIFIFNLMTCFDLPLGIVNEEQACLLNFSEFCRKPAVPSKRAGRVSSSR